MAKIVLVVEDDPLLRMLTVEMVAAAGLSVVEAEDADHALKLLQQDAHEIAVIITDIRMPGHLDGVDLAKAVSSAWPRISILVTSGYDAGRRQELAPGIKFLPKPWHALDVINFVLDGVDKASHSAPEM